jgi:superfamily I DNA/RNA helicase
MLDARDAEELFERASAPLFSADWADYLGPEIDPEIPGLRAPDRFADAVFRLIGKLRDAQIDPDAFLTLAQRGAAAFYANPPNLTAPALLYATKDEHRPALVASTSELDRQRRRELDLAKVIAKLYRSYLDEQVARGCLTATDALAEATRLLDEHPAIAKRTRERFRIALVDDAHDLHPGEFRFLQALFGKALFGVTAAGDPDAATQTFAGARPERVWNAAATTIRLATSHRVPAQIAGVARALLDGTEGTAAPSGTGVRIHRATTLPNEAAFVAEQIAGLIAAGTPPERIALTHRSLRGLRAFEDALLARDIPIVLAGDGALFERRDALDALALLWSVADPFRHAWLLRALQLPLTGLSDATLATLCGEPTSPQAPLFDLPLPDITDGTRRWDRRRDVRLGMNVLRGDRDDDLPGDARERLRAFRARREEWQAYAARADVPSAAEAIVRDSGISAARSGETSAQHLLRVRIVDALLAVIARYAQRTFTGDLAGALEYCERIASASLGPVFTAEDDARDVVVAAIEHIKHRRFSHVFVVDVRAGSFPPYYVPDAFLFSPTHGMIPKDNVGDAQTARTAKFTWYQFQAKLRETYGREDRRALAVAMQRADESVTISASGKATRAVAAPEFVSELLAMRPALPVLGAPAC